MLLVGLYDNFPNSHGKVTFPPTPHHVNENKVNQENDTFMRNNNPSKKKNTKANNKHRNVIFSRTHFKE